MCAACGRPCHFVARTEACLLVAGGRRWEAVRVQTTARTTGGGAGCDSLDPAVGVGRRCGPSLFFGSVAAGFGFFRAQVSEHRDGSSHGLPRRRLWGMDPLASRCVLCFDAACFFLAVHGRCDPELAAFAKAPPP